MCGDLDLRLILAPLHSSGLGPSSRLTSSLPCFSTSIHKRGTIALVQVLHSTACIIDISCQKRSKFNGVLTLVWILFDSLSRCRTLKMCGPCLPLRHRTVPTCNGEAMFDAKYDKHQPRTHDPFNGRSIPEYLPALTRGTKHGAETWPYRPPPTGQVASTDHGQGTNKDRTGQPVERITLDYSFKDAWINTNTGLEETDMGQHIRNISMCLGLASPKNHKTTTSWLVTCIVCFKLMTLANTNYQDAGNRQRNTARAQGSGQCS
ncbi:hypothetical protein BDZ85DRAFT_96278 [Elsinoe ampelina]|uniref:Uncharacterized protein n=1 Tax=Elsinoe ampelina TaxID=302913 RepID=A0A6A6GE83_9PEZI|nr:hypothetical protein BDZ85DRAFT_96278 [Elsinoe ampelina]